MENALDIIPIEEGDDYEDSELENPIQFRYLFFFYSFIFYFILT